jgi:hypothetical protein
LSGPPMVDTGMRLYDTAGREVRPLEADGPVRLYT